MIVKRGDGDYATVYRPLRISEVYGQDTIKTILAKGLNEDSLSKTLFFLGASGTGKTSMARIIAMGLNCERGRTSEPCGECESCCQVINGNHFAFEEINAADLTGVDKMRQLRDTFDFMPMGDFEKKIVLFDECHRLSEASQTLLLRVVEDAKNHLQFIFCSTQMKGIIETLSNRCLKLEFDRLATGEIVQLLKDICTWELIKFQTEMLEALARESEGMVRNALFLLQKVVARGDLEKVGRRREIEIIEKEGGSNILLVAPHGVYHDDDYTGEVARGLAHSLRCCAVINEKYQKPETVGFDHPDPGRGLVNLNRLDQIGNYDEVKGEFLDPIVRLKEGISRKNGHGLIVFIHGISDENINAVEKQVSTGNPKTSLLDMLIGFGQAAGGQSLLTASQKHLIEPLINSMKEAGINAVIAPTKAIAGTDKVYCGNNPNGLNQHVRDQNLKIQSIQLEIKKSRFREDEETAAETGKLLGQAFVNLSLQKPEVGILLPTKEEAKAEVKAPEPPLQETEPPLKESFWSAPTQKPEMKKIRVGEIELENTKFMLRAPELGVEQEKLHFLVSTIKSGGIHQNIILRKIPGKDKFQVLSGFRRLSALEKALDDEGRKEEFKNQEVWAEVYDDTLSDEQAYQVSLSENLAREELSVWEMAKCIRAMRDDLLREGKKKGEIERCLATITNKEPRTIRRFLQVSRIENQDIRKDIHKGSIDFSIATIFARKEFSEDDRAALHLFFKRHPMPLRKLYAYVKKLMRLREWAKMSMTEILALPEAKEILSLDFDALREKVESFRKAEKGTVTQILEKHLAEIKNSISGGKSKTDLAPFLDKFSKKSVTIEKRVNSLLADKKLTATFRIRPARNLEPNVIDLSISSPLKDAATALKIAAKEIKEDWHSLERAFQYLPKGEKAKSEEPKTSQ